MQVTGTSYLRVHATYIGRVGVEVGVFVAVDHLRRAGLLAEAEEATYLDIDDWFLANLPEPPFYADGNSIGAVTWFKVPAAAGMLRRVEPLLSILRAHGVEHRVSRCDDPGTIVYEDAWQVAVVPHRRLPPTPLPDDVVLGPTTAGSKRHLAGAAARRTAVPGSA